MDTHMNVVLQTIKTRAVVAIKVVQVSQGAVVEVYSQSNS